MENCIRRFPVVGALILNNLDDQTLVKNKETSREISDFINNERFYWNRIIQKYNDNGRQNIKNIPIQDLKALAMESEKSYWIGVVEKCLRKFRGHEEAWKEVIDKIPINIVKQLATAVE